MQSLMINGKELYWKRISLISFVLAVFIIIRHNSSIYNYDAPFVLQMYDGFKYSVTEIAVPLFFMISGFNFFNGFTMERYKKKFSGRIKSLLVPYVTWNVLYCAFCILISFPYFSRFFVGRDAFVVTPLNVFLGCVFHNTCNSHFWFVFDLMVCVLLNPILYYVIKNKICGMILLLFLYGSIMFLGFKLPVDVFYRTDAFLYYYIGAFLGLHCHRFFCEDTRWAHDESGGSGIQKGLRSHAFYYVLGIVCLCASGLLLIPDLPGTIRCPIILIAAYGFWKVSACCRFLRFRWLPQGGTVFLMYAAHGILQPVIVKLLYLALPKQNWAASLNFVLAVLVTILACVGIRCLAKRFAPPVDKIITGFRR